MKMMSFAVCLGKNFSFLIDYCSDYICVRFLKISSQYWWKRFVLDYLAKKLSKNLYFNRMSVTRGTKSQFFFGQIGFTDKLILSIQKFSYKENNFIIFRSKIGKYSFLFGAEMDGYKAQDKQSIGKLVPNRFVEFKTSRRVENERQDRTLRKFKMIKWWAQCFLGNLRKH